MFSPIIFPAALQPQAVGSGLARARWWSQVCYITFESVGYIRTPSLWTQSPRVDAREKTKGIFYIPWSWSFTCALKDTRDLCHFVSLRFQAISKTTNMHNENVYFDYMSTIPSESEIMDCNYTVVLSSLFAPP